MATASSALLTLSRKYPPMASLDSANGPSVTVRPFLPETTLPEGCSGFPPTALPCSVSRLNQAIHCSNTCCISSGDSPWHQSVPRKISMWFASVVCALIITFLLIAAGFQPFIDTTNGGARSGHLFGPVVSFPNGKDVVLRVLTDCEIAHLGNGRLGHADLAAEFLDLGRGF